MGELHRTGSDKGAAMRLSEILIDDIAKKLKTGMSAKAACQAEGIYESTFYGWKNDGEEIHKRATDKDGETIEKEVKKLSDMQKLKLEFYKSINKGTAQGQAILAAAMFSAIGDDWRAAESILSRRFPKDWAKRDNLHIDQVVEEKPNKLKEIEDEVFAGIPSKNRKEVIEKMTGVIEEARNGKNPGKTKRKSKASA